MEENKGSIKEYIKELKDISKEMFPLLGRFIIVFMIITIKAIVRFVSYISGKIKNRTKKAAQSNKDSVIDI